MVGGTKTDRQDTRARAHTHTHTHTYVQCVRGWLGYVFPALCCKVTGREMGSPERPGLSMMFLILQAWAPLSRLRDAFLLGRPREGWGWWQVFPSSGFVANQGQQLLWWLRGWSICLQCGRPRFDPWVGRIHWRRKWQPTPVLLPGEFHGRRSLGGCSPQGHKESDTTEWLHFQGQQAKVRQVVTCQSNSLIAWYLLLFSYVPAFGKVYCPCSQLFSATSL